MKRFGDLCSADLGQTISEPEGVYSNDPVMSRIPVAPVSGELRSVHHFRVDGQSYTAALVQTGAQYATFRYPSDMQIEVTER